MHSLLFLSSYSPSFLFFLSEVTSVEGFIAKRNEWQKRKLFPSLCKIKKQTWKNTSKRNKEEAGEMGRRNEMEQQKV
jgi:hypothetical protein